MKTRTRRFKVVSYLVLLTMIVSLLGPMGTMKKVMAADYIENLYYSNGSWYSAAVREEYKVNNILEVIDDKDRITIYDHPQEALASLGTAVRNFDHISLDADPGSDYSIPSNIGTKSLSVAYTPSSTGKYYYTGNVNRVENLGGNLSVKGDISWLFLGFFNDKRQKHIGKMEVIGNVEIVEWFKKTEVIPDAEFLSGYSKEDMNRSINGCDNGSTLFTYFSGDFSIQGKVDKLNVMELYYNAKFDSFYFPVKAQVSNFNSAVEMKSIITDGQLASNIPAENLKASSTSEWVQEFLEHYKMHYNVSYDKDHYVWSAIVTYDGEPCHNEKTFTTLDANNLPQGVDLKGASVAVYETGKDGITFPAEIELSELSIESGKVNVEGNVSSVTVVDDSRFYFTTDPGCFFLHVKGNVSKLLINDISANTNIIVDGNVTEGSLKTLKTGVDFHFQEDFATFSKKVGQTSDIIEGGTLNHNFMLSTGEGDNALSYSIDNNLVDLETAAGVTDATRATEYEAVDFDEALQYQSAGARLLLKTLDENTVQAIESKVDLEDGYQITNKAVDIKVGTFYICGGLKPSKKITSTSTPLKINIVIPDYKEGVKYGIVRVHDNGDGTTSYDVLPTTVLNGVISFASDKFSDFVLINNDGGIDVTAPSISNNYQKDATSMEVTVTDSGSGVDTVSYTIDNGAAQTAVLTNGKFTIPSLKEGRYNVVVTAKDKSGNKSSETIPVVSLYTVNFFYGANDDSKAFATEIVEYGNDASAPIVAKRPGFDSVGWSKSFTKVVSDIDVEALWNITGVKVTPYTGTYDRNTHNMISIDGLNPSDVVSYRTDGKLYTTNCPSVTAAGNYSVYVKIDREGLDTWYSPKYTIAVTKKAITASMINKLPTVEFNGKQYCPVPVITDGTYTLKEGTDFTLTYLNNRNSGTALVNVVGKGNYAGNVELSFQILEKKGEVKIKDNKTPQVAATNLNKLYEDETIYTPEDRQIEENGGTVNIKLEVQSQIVPVADQSKIKQIAKDKKIGLFLDISLFKMVQLAGATNGNTSQISHTNQLLSIVIPIPDEVKGRKGVELYRVHNGVPAIIPIGAENAINGEYCTIDSKNITLYVRNFSTYAIGYSTSDIKSPKTGEESSKLPWILLGFGLAAVGTGVVVRKKRKCKLILK